MLLLAFGECEHPCAAGTWTIWQQFGNNVGNASPTWLQCCWQKSGDVTVCQTSDLTVSPTCFQCDGDGRRAGLKIRSSKKCRNDDVARPASPSTTTLLALGVTARRRRHRRMFPASRKARRTQRVTQ